MKVYTTYDPIDIAISGIKAQNRNIKLISSNVANAQSTNTAQGEPYRRLEAVFKTDGDGIGGVSIDEVVADMSQFPKVLKPGHPDADAQGYVAMPNVSLPKEMSQLSAAAKTYQANLAILKRYQQMVESTLELLK